MIRVSVPDHQRPSTTGSSVPAIHPNRASNIQIQIQSAEKPSRYQLLPSIYIYRDYIGIYKELGLCSLAVFQLGRVHCRLTIWTRAGAQRMSSNLSTVSHPLAPALLPASHMCFHRAATVSAATDGVSQDTPF